MDTPTLKQMIETLYENRDKFDGYMRTLIEVWKRAADEGRLERIGHNSIRFIRRAYYGR